MPIPNTIPVHGDNVPVYGSTPTIVSLGGAWSNPASWDLGRVPNATDSVHIAPGTFVTIDTDSAICENLVVEGDLWHFESANTRLSVGTATVLSAGAWLIGEPQSPITAKAEVIFRDGPFAADDPDEYGRGLIVLGKFGTHGLPKTPFVRTLREVLAGATDLRVEQEPVGWLPGDQLCIPDTAVLESDRWKVPPERPNLDSVLGDTLILQQSLAQNHYGCWDKDGALRYTCHVANSTRNVVLRSENPNGTRGHCLFLNGSDVQVRHTEVAHMGRTRAQTTGPGNHIARYPIHGHHQAIVVEGCAIRDSRRWPVVIHGCNGMQVLRNVIVSAEGSGIMFETAVEINNTVKGNFVCGITGNGQRADGGGGNEGVGIWCGNPDNTISDNVCADCTNHGFVIYNKAALTTVIREFDRNETYATAGMTPWYLGLGSDLRSHPVDGGTIRDLVCWNFLNGSPTRSGIYFYPSGGLTFERAVILSCWKRQATAWWQKEAIASGDYHVYKIKFVDSEFQAPGTPFLAYPCATPLGEPVATEHVFERCKFSGPYAVKVGTIWHNGRKDIGPRKIRFTDCLFREGRGTWPFNAEFSTPPPQKVWGGWEKFRSIAQPMQFDETIFENFDGVQGDSFKYYAPEQEPAFVVPATTTVPPLLIAGQDAAGMPVSGKTNAEHWALYGRAWRGEVMPANAVPKVGVLGKVVPLGSPPPVNQPPVAVNDSATTPFETPVTINVLANDSDPDGSLDPATVVTSSPNGGVCAPVAGGSVTFTPAAGFSGVGGFDYTVKDNQGATSNVGHVTVTVQAKPPDPTDPCEVYKQQIVQLQATIAALEAEVASLKAKLAAIHEASKP